MICGLAGQTDSGGGGYVSADAEVATVGSSSVALSPLTCAHAASAHVPQLFTSTGLFAFDRILATRLATPDVHQGEPLGINPIFLPSFSLPSSLPSLIR